MLSFDKPSPDEGVPSDLLSVIRRSGVLAERQYEAVRANVEGGEYPSEPHALAERLVQDEILTRFQADRLLQNKVHGLVIDRYVILERLGEGAMGRVFKAQHRLLGRLVALKLIAPHYASRARSVARFRRELRLIGRLDHPHIIRAYDADRIGSSFYLVMEYVRGQSLDRVLEGRGPLPPDEVINYAAQAALGLAHAHGQGIVHRDVKPSNLMLTDDGQIKLLDLGLGTLIDADDQTSFATAAGRAVGTTDFMSPEQASGRDVDGRSDCFGLGCTAYVLMTGCVPFPADTSLERLVRRLKAPPVPITDLLPELPSAVVQVLEKLLARRPEDRFETAAEAAEALRALLQGGRSGAPAGPPAPTPTPPGPLKSSPGPAAPSESPSDPADWSPSSAPSNRPSADSTSVHSLMNLVERSPRIVLATLLAVLIAAFLAGFTLGRL
jgi:serine/threonine-protein kinase